MSVTYRFTSPPPRTHVESLQNAMKCLPERSILRNTRIDVSRVITASYSTPPHDDRLHLFAEAQPFMWGEKKTEAVGVFECDVIKENRVLLRTEGVYHYVSAVGGTSAHISGPLVDLANIGALSEATIYSHDAAVLKTIFCAELESLFQTDFICHSFVLDSMSPNRRRIYHVLANDREDGIVAISFAGKEVPADVDMDAACSDEDTRSAAEITERPVAWDEVPLLVSLGPNNKPRTISLRDHIEGKRVYEECPKMNEVIMVLDKDWSRGARRLYPV